jgi:UDP-N-acetylglucosamine 3-dehydrogenase
MGDLRRLRVAVVGVGAMGRNHARVLSEIPRAELVGVADTDLENAQKVAHRCGATAWSDYLRMFDEAKLDAVTIAVPTAEHLRVAQVAIERGLHLFVEKPIALTTEEARQMIELARQRGVCLMIGHIERFNPAVLAMKERLRTGELGRVFQIEARRQSPFPARVEDVGVVIDLAVHDIDIMRYVSESEITRVYAETARRIHGRGEDMLTGLLRLGDGSIGTLIVNWLTPAKIRELFVTGERGMYRVDYITQDLYFYENAVAQEEEWETLGVLRGVSEGRMIRFVVNKREPLRVEHEHFLAAVSGETEIQVTGEDGLRALEVAHALIAAAEDHRVHFMS